MTDISRFGTGERGVFKLDREPEYKTKINHEMLNRKVERGEWWINPDTKQIEPYKPEKKDKFASAWFIRDEIPPTMSHATPEGKVFTSRSALFRHYKEEGVECTFGEHIKPEPRKKLTPEQLKDMWAKAEADAKYDRVPMTEAEKQAAIDEERSYQAWVKRQRS